MSLPKVVRDSMQWREGQYGVLTAELSGDAQLHPLQAAERQKVIQVAHPSPFHPSAMFDRQTHRQTLDARFFLSALL